MGKVWYRSATLWALVASALAHLLGLSGLGEDEASHLAAEIIESLAPAVGLIADSVGLWARSRAKGPLTLTTDPERIE